MQKLAGAVLLGIGVLLLVGSGAYYAYGAVAKSNLDKLSYSAERPTATGIGDAGAPSRRDSGEDVSRVVSSQESGGGASHRPAPPSAVGGEIGTDARPAGEMAISVETIGGEAPSPSAGAEGPTWRAMSRAFRLERRTFFKNT